MVGTLSVSSFGSGRVRSFHGIRLRLRIGHERHFQFLNGFTQFSTMRPSQPGTSNAGRIQQDEFVGPECRRTFRKFFEQPLKILRNGFVRVSLFQHHNRHDCAHLGCKVIDERVIVLQSTVQSVHHDALIEKHGRVRAQELLDPLDQLCFVDGFGEEAIALDALRPFDGFKIGMR